MIYELRIRAELKLIGNWVRYDAAGNFVPGDRGDEMSFLETIGVETAYPHQLRLVKPAQETVVLSQKERKVVG